MDLPGSPAGDTWPQYLAYHAEVPESEDLRSRGLSEMMPCSTPALERAHLSAKKEYFTFAESVLRAHGAILPEGASTLGKPAADEIWTDTYHATSQRSGYKRLSDYTEAPVHLKVLYDELYEACWKGDNATIRELCLPKRVAEGKQPIQIAVKSTVIGA